MRAHVGLGPEDGWGELGSEIRQWLFMQREGVQGRVRRRRRMQGMARGFAPPLRGRVCSPPHTRLVHGALLLAHKR